MAAPEPVAERRMLPLPEIAVVLWTVAVAALTTLGADLLWVVAMGDDIKAMGAVPDGVPFAAAPQVDWPNPLVLAQLLLSVVASLPVGLAALNLLVVAATLAVLVHDGRRMRTGDFRNAVAVSLVVIGGSAALVVARLPALSLLPFVVLAALLRRVDERPSRRVWWVVPLVALWGNLHGGVLVGMAVVGVFLVLARGAGPLWQRAAVGLASVAALFATSAGLGTARYYLGVMGNEARVRGTDLWAPPSLGHPLDVAMLVAALVLLAMAFRRGLPWWEWAVVAGLAVGTVLAARNGVWLLLFLAPAAAGDRRPGAKSVPSARPTWWRPVVAGVALTGAAVCLGVLLARGPAVQPRGQDVVATVADLAGDGVVLADEPLAETLAAGGLTVWASNPIDAFPRDVQGHFLDFLHDGTVPDDPSIGVVAVASDELGADVERSGEWTAAVQTGGYTVFVRR